MLPELIEEDVKLLDQALDELLRHSESKTALIIDKGGPLISQRGIVEDFDTTTISALAAGSFCATAAIAGLVGETDFSNIYQQGERHSVLFCNVDENVLLIVIFRAEIAVGAVKYFAEATVKRVSQQLQKAGRRSNQGVDLVSMNTLDASSIFRKGPQP